MFCVVFTTVLSFFAAFLWQKLLKSSFFSACPLRDFLATAFVFFLGRFFVCARLLFSQIFFAAAAADLFLRTVRFLCFFCFAFQRRVRFTVGALAAFVIILVKLFRKSAAPHVLDSFSIMSKEQFAEGEGSASYGVLFYNTVMAAFIFCLGP